MRSEEAGATFSGTVIASWQLVKELRYTETGQVWTEKDGAGNQTTKTYDAMDRLEQIEDPVGRKTRYEYDLAGQQLKEIRAYGTALQQSYATYTYTPNGQRATVKDANNNLSTFSYDAFDRVASLSFPMPTSGASVSNPNDKEIYGYDANGNRTSLTKRSGQVIGFTYDPLNRLRLKDIPGGTAADVYYNYDRAGRRSYARFGSDSGNGVDYGYNTAGQLISETTIGRAMSFGYDAAGNRNRVTWPDANFVSYSFDPMNRMTEVRQNSTTVGTGVLATYGYDVRSRRDWITRANGANSDYGYDAASRLDALSHDFAGTASDVSLGFGYTLASQLQTRTSSNRVFDWTTVLPDRTYVPNGLNQYASVSGTSFSHDANGNLTSDGSRTFGYDVENRLTSVSGSATLAVSYDPMGRLYQTVGGATTQFLYDGDRLVAEYGTGGTLLRRYVHGPGVDDPIVWYEGSGLTDRRWIHADERGSTVATSDGSGAVSVYTYGPFGEPAAWTGARFRYTGQISLPEVQLYYYKARVYDPGVGRFLQTDPIGFDDDINLYAYTYNDPLNRTDPTGKIAGVDDAAIILVAAVAVGAYAACEAYCDDVATGVGNFVGAAADGARGIYTSVKGMFNEAKGQQTDQGKKSPPNPNGSRGSQEHQDKIKDRIGELEGEGHTHVAGADKKEETVATPGGTKESRRPDITTIGPDGKPYRENVGRQNQDGSPVSRERKAQDDIRNATGQCAFTPYNCK